MAGIYIHIPFCKKACHYCDFHFSTNLDNRAEMLKAILQEAKLRKDYLATKKVNTIYFGGGTPSLLNRDEIKTVIDRMRELFEVTEDAEITLEANPDDLTSLAVLQDYRSAGINRLSIGIQSFYDEHLTWMNRAHNAAQAESSVKLAQEAGFDNITVDLIYGIPNMTNEQWLTNLDKALALNIQHLSAYCLTVEERTVLHKMMKEGKAKEAPDDDVEWQVDTLVDKLEEKGIERYEISNFAIPGKESRHNSAYWEGAWYLGLGPSAHSFNGSSREWNVSNNAIYIKQVAQGEGIADTEPIDETTAYNEYIMTRLRTSKGINLQEVKKQFAIDLKVDFEEEIAFMIEDEEATLEDGVLKLTHLGRFFADGLAASLFLEQGE
ncbi:MAG: radical SAM family heme chaperone HemW [Bacteroidota bacterium]